MLLAPGTVIAGRYRLERPLASGGMGSVWVGRHVTLQTDVAIKFISTESTASQAARARFEREARSAAHLRHPNVVAVQDYGIENETPYLVMELLRGESLEERIHSHGRLSLAALAQIVQQMSRGLRKAHEAGIVHRDLKPGNVFLARDDDDEVEVVKILDFGIAKETDMSLGEATKTSELMGSPHYMSPEQLRSSKKTDVRSDLWSVGVVLYRALTGKIPFPGDTLAEVMVQVFSARLPPATSIVPELPPAIDAFFQRALARNPDDRFQSIRELAEAFQSVASGRGMPAAPAPPSPPEGARGSLPSVNALGTPLPVAPPMGGVPPAPSSSPGLSAPQFTSPAPASSRGFGGLTQPEAALRSPHPPGVPAAPNSSRSPSAPQFAPAAPTSSPGLSAPPISSPGLSAPQTLASTTTPPVPVVGPDAPPPLVPGGPTAPPVSMPTFPEAATPQPPADASAAPLGAPFQEPPAAAPFPAPPGAAAPEREPPNPLDPRASRRTRQVQAAVIGVLVVGLLVAIVLIASRRSPDPEAAASPPEATSPDSAGAATAAGTALTPDEMAAAVPDETPIEILADEAAAAPSATQAPRPSGWKPIPKGHGRLLIRAKGGICKVTVNGVYYGVTPVDAIVETGKQRIFCRMPTGSTRSKELRAPEFKVTKVEFEVKQ
ncbi:serine/threonine protein kinase [Polyangium jinanense]|uniref:non-specific serine/threonine protein kinase n=1 Tax=Polyangium jinanense TaxID=2829994 RepID=A0A9X4AU93_9BACT|nr:serine/threonine protein kinase [Polyangium jinanense]MDC3956135.1 protein kinase [Polyangium jinanense]MDC3983030.1 protein kinase [Polyangium jinanense]